MYAKPEIEPAALRIADACRYLSIGRTSVYRLIAEGRLRPVKFGTATLIPRSQLDALLATGDDAKAAA
jgi:excisionase family DNA binding protein